MNSYVSKFVQLLGKNFDEVLSNFPMCTKILYPIPQYSCFSLPFFVISVIIDVALCVCECVYFPSTFDMVTCLPFNLGSEYRLSFVVAWC